MAVGGHVSQVHEIDLKIVEKLAMASQVSGAAQRERSRSRLRISARAVSSAGFQSSPRIKLPDIPLADAGDPNQAA